jgi:hypothetical protein
MIDALVSVSSIFPENNEGCLTDESGVLLRGVLRRFMDLLRKSERRHPCKENLVSIKILNTLTHKIPNRSPNHYNQPTSILNEDSVGTILTFGLSFVKERKFEHC